MTRELLTGSHPLLADQVRLAILAMLAAAAVPLEFMELVDGLQLTKGNLCSHMRKLEEAALVTVTKEFVDRKPRTRYACTASGRNELVSYLEKIERALRAVASRS